MNQGRWAAPESNEKTAQEPLDSSRKYGWIALLVCCFHVKAIIPPPVLADQSYVAGGVTFRADLDFPADSVVRTVR